MASRDAFNGQQLGRDHRDHLSVLPNELLVHIASFLTGTEDTLDARKEVYQNVNLVCKALHNVIEAFLYEDMVLTINLTDELPPDRAPLRWTRPPLQSIFEQAPKLAAFVRSIRLRIEPFPFEEWTAERCREVLGKLKGRKPYAYPHGPFTPPEGRETLVATAYCERISECCSDDDWVQRGQPVAEDATRLLVDVLRLVSNLKHVQVAAWRNSIRKRNTVTMQQSLAYATQLLLTAAPACVDSLRIVALESQRAGYRLPWDLYNAASNHDPNFGVPDYMLDPVNFLPHPVEHFHTRLSTFAVQLTSLYVEVCANALNYWARVLVNLPNVTKLAVSFAGDLSSHKETRRCLQILLGQLVMPQVTHLDLVNWVATSSFLVAIPQRKLVALKHLRLHGIVLDTERTKGEFAWPDVIQRLLASGTSLQAVDVEEPCQCAFKRRRLKILFKPQSLTPAATEKLIAALR
ncbi:hypothetical protein LTR36_007508 [Oleoguttula mirabilis]|uniref:F-box domain-containing protein n=1 Tax=Oleoguttula mirabilis TaxID=1507867 RepID=A0AAV9JVL6_9PEZI|nr:hypothetical protein LTR36_007508 [Oleoguttula mirabilis]